MLKPCEVITLSQTLDEYRFALVERLVELMPRGVLDVQVIKSLYNDTIPDYLPAYEVVLKRIKVGQDRSEALICLSALEQIREGNHGICRCGEKISEKRLRLKPFAFECEDCDSGRRPRKSRPRQLPWQLLDNQSYAHQSTFMRPFS